MIKPFPNQLSSLRQQETLDPPPRVSGKMPVEGVSDVLWNKGGKNLNQRRDIFRGDQPDALDQDFSIFMSKDIPQSHHALPRNLAMLLLVALRHSFSGFSDNKQLPFYGITRFFV